MAEVKDKGTGDIISSLWEGLSPHLIASFYEVDRQGEKVKDKDGKVINIVVRAPLTESSLDGTFNWQSPFESMSPETRAPTLFAMLQSGAVQPAIDAVNGAKVGKFISGIFGDSAGKQVAETISSTQKSLGAELKNFEGRTGITKLNSTQVFSGMPPIKIQVTALFRAWRDPVAEVMKPADQLMAWAFPETLSSDAVAANMVKAAQGEKGFIDALLPSKSPKLLALTYKNRTFKPLVIEAISLPLNSSIDAKGNFVELLIPMTLATLTAWDAQDWANTSKKTN
ncbi:hypothetical protein KFZ76_06975 [Methylovulum psychrotolerans]|uniref:hypothetical protein n=1 Tax=Methylovulum psychrotolerans TaxID=1704499 RepID=UPI001BFEF770|nr:hypothetical protein [Methylovulum psychrotolerans]MBT9097453.1 hypothetical protein [Methylovulum psychrotolerans]